MTTGLAEACVRLAFAFPEAAILVAQQDTTGTAPGGKPGSRPPWNPQAAAAFYDAYEGVRRLHIMLHAEVTGQPLRHVSTAARATGAHLRAIAALGVNASRDSALAAERDVNRWVAPIDQLPARDLVERWLSVAGASCYHCQVPMLRLAPRSGRVTCLRYGACFDCQGKHPVGFVMRGLDGDPLVDWQDGCIQHGTLEESAP